MRKLVAMLGRPRSKLNRLSRRSKKVKTGCNMDEVVSDRISDLPHDVMCIILSRLPLQDAVRTSILSKKWKLHWTRIESLVFDKYFYYIFISILDEVMRLSEYVSTVMNVLSSHGGPVRKFLLYVPSCYGFVASKNIDPLVLRVSEFGVEDLTLEFKDEDQRFPDSVFRCVKLKHLSLNFGLAISCFERFTVIPTHGFRELSSLVSLSLRRDEMDFNEVAEIISNCPLLERLCLDYNDIAISSNSRVITAPKLKHLSVEYECCMYFRLIYTPNISTLFLRSELVLEHTGSEDIVGFFCAIQKVETINLNGGVLLEWPQNIPEKLPTLLENHLSLTVCDLSICSLKQIRSMFCLIKSSPKLETLDISICWPEHGSKACFKYFISQQNDDVENLSSLRTVKISGLKGGKFEKFFIGIFLSRCPYLQKLYLRSRDHIRINPGAKSKMIAGIKKLRKRVVSSQAKIIYL